MTHRHRIAASVLLVLVLSGCSVSFPDKNGGGSVVRSGTLGVSGHGPARVLASPVPLPPPDARTVISRAAGCSPDIGNSVLLAECHFPSSAYLTVSTYRTDAEQGQEVAAWPARDRWVPEAAPWRLTGPRWTAEYAGTAGRGSVDPAVSVVVKQLRGTIVPTGK